MKVGKKIRMLRELLGYSQDYMSIELEISQTTYSRIENDSTKIDLSKLMCITNILGVDLICLLQFDEKNIGSFVNNCFLQPMNNTSETNKFNEDRIMQLEKRVDLIHKIIGTTTH